MEKTVTKSFNGKNLQQMTKLTEDLSVVFTPGVCLPLPWGLVYAYTRPRYQVSVYRTIGPMVLICHVVVHLLWP